MPDLKDLFSKEVSTSDTAVIYAIALTDSEDGEVTIQFDDPISDITVDDVSDLDELSESVTFVDDGVDDDTIEDIDLDSISEELGEDDDEYDVDSDETYETNDDEFLNEFSIDPDDPLTNIVEE